MKVADALAIHCMKFTMEKDWEPDSVFRLKFLPRLCDLRKPEFVEQWVETHFEEYKTKTAAATAKSNPVTSKAAANVGTKHNTRANPSAARKSSSSESECEPSSASADDYELDVISADTPSTSKQSFTVR